MFSIIKQLVTGDTSIPTIKSTELKELLVKQLGSHLISNLIILSDETYSLLSYVTAQKLYAQSGLILKKYQSEKFDCDDFSAVFKAFVADKQRESWEIIYPYAFGLLYGNLPNPHAINWFIDSNKTLHFMEPQTGEIFAPTGKVFFLYT